jgi:hypothetical protein
MKPAFTSRRLKEAENVYQNLIVWIYIGTKATFAISVVVGRIDG